MSEAPILVVNTGSSSLKLGLFCAAEGDERLLVDVLAEGIGGAEGKLTVRAGGKVIGSESLKAASQTEALHLAAPWLAKAESAKPVGIGHRVVHGGPNLTTHQRITPELIRELRACIHFAPLHIPVALELIAATERAYPGVPQFACFDTAFHRTMPEVATRFALPRELFEQGIRRYGFHGLSYESIVFQLGKDLPPHTVAAHLGSGAGLAAILDGKSVDTSMGLTPTGGIPMATRSGDLDPGVLLYLLQAEGATPESLERMLNHDAGLKALSGGTADMRALEQAADSGDTKAVMAIAIFCRSIAKTVAAYAAVLGGLDMLVFAGGIGEHSERVRREVCAQLEFLGVALDEERNRAGAAIFSAADSKVQVRVVASEEDRQIARHTRSLLQPGAEI
jgi:acetate kinase